MNMNTTPEFSTAILDSLNDGLYVCDKERRILYWSKSAQRITGWLPLDVIGHKCSDNILCHVDKDGRQLCGEEFCPLHRSITTGKSATYPVVLFAQTKDGQRVPLVVSVSPMRDADGNIIGGIETFHDFTESYANLERAQRIQSLSLAHDLPEDARVGFSTFYLPQDVVGGDFFSIRPLDGDRYGFFLADVMGHGFAAALYTMHLSSLWVRDSDSLATPAEFASRMNRELGKVVRGESFATGLCGVLDVEAKRLRFTSAGGPPMLLFRAGGEIEELQAPGFPFGVLGEAPYDEIEVALEAGDKLLLFSDGAVEIHNEQGQELGTEGLLGILKNLGYPQTGLQVEALQEALLRFSNGIRLEDDVTFLELRLSAHPAGG